MGWGCGCCPCSRIPCAPKQKAQAVSALFLNHPQVLQGREQPLLWTPQSLAKDPLLGISKIK